MNLTRRTVLRTGTLAAAARALPLPAATDPIALYRTPYKYPKLLLGPSKPAPATLPPQPGDPFDSRSVDDPIVFRAEGKFQMLYIGFDGTGYQTGLASSVDLLHWTRDALVGPRDPSSRYTKYNLAISSILRDKRLDGRGEAIKINGHYLAAWNAYPGAGYEEGAAVIGLARSHDLRHWTLSEPILRPEDGAAWERGGLYRPDLLLEERNGRRTFYLYYNAKTEPLPATEGGGWHERTGVASSGDLRTWTRYTGNPLLQNGPRGSATYPAGGPAHAGPAADAPDSRFASNPFVMTHAGQYAMFYFGFNYERPGRARELLALGDDPFHFTKVPGVLIDVGAPGTIDETFAHKPSLLYHDGALYHFYCAVAGTYPNETRGIAVARSRPW